MSRILKKRTLTFVRPTTAGYTDSSGRFVRSQEASSTFDVRGSLQPMTNQEMQTMPLESGTSIKSAYYFYTRTEDLRPISKNAKEADKTEIGGATYVVWSNTPWEGVTRQVKHNVVVLVRQDEVPLT